MAEHTCSAKVPNGRNRWDWKPCPHKAKFYRISAAGSRIAYTCGIHEKVENVELDWQPITVDTVDPEILVAYIGRKNDYKLECQDQMDAWVRERLETVDIIRRATERMRQLAGEAKLPDYGTTILRSDRDKPREKGLEGMWVFRNT